VKDNIRIPFPNSSKNACISYAQQIKDDIVIKPSVNGSYKHQLKIDKILEEKEIISSITIHKYFNSSRNCITFLVIVYGKKNGRNQTLNRISFGGKNIKEEESKQEMIHFTNKLKDKLNESLFIDKSMS